MLGRAQRGEAWSSSSNFAPAYLLEGVPVLLLEVELILLLEVVIMLVLDLTMVVLVLEGALVVRVHSV